MSPAIRILTAVNAMPVSVELSMPATIIRQWVFSVTAAFRNISQCLLKELLTARDFPAKELALIEPFSISCHALSRAEVKNGDNLLIMGAGPIGLFALIKAKSMGARVLIADMLSSRLDLAKDLVQTVQ